MNTLKWYDTETQKLADEESTHLIAYIPLPHVPKPPEFLIIPTVDGMSMYSGPFSYDGARYFNNTTEAKNYAEERYQEMLSKFLKNIGAYSHENKTFDPPHKEENTFSP